jgi:uncharacterized damage-inducible protein DinB
MARKAKTTNRATSRAKRAKKSPDTDASLRKHLVELLKGGEAHVGLADALADFPADKRVAAAQGLQHTAWQLLEHIRIAQWDILEFSRNPKHVSPDFPDGYWPKPTAAPDEAAWEQSLRAAQNDLQAMIKLVSDSNADLYAAFPWGSGQTLLREALLLADHNAYHVGQLVDLRRALGIWNK